MNDNKKNTITMSQAINMAVSNEANIITIVPIYVMKSFNNFLEDLGSKAGMLTEYSKGKNPELHDLKKNINEIRKIKEKVSYSDITEIEVPIITGLKENLYESVRLVEEYFEVNENNIVDFLEETNNLLSNVLTNKNFRTRSRPYKGLDIIYTANANGATLVKELIDPNKNIDRAKLVELIPNVNSLSVIGTKLIELEKFITVESLNKLNEKVNDLSSLTKELIIEMDTESFEVNKETLDNLAWSLEQLAEYVTIYIRICYITNQLAAMTNNIYREIKKKY